MQKIPCLALGFIFSTLASFSLKAGVEPTKVLFIGNSYTHMNDMPGIFAKIAIEAGRSVHVEKSTQSGASFKVHSKRPETYEAIKKKKWDYVVLQGYSKEFAYQPGHIDTASIPYINKIIDSVYANNPCTNILFYMTWGYEAGCEISEETNSYEKMAGCVERGYSYLSEIYNLPIVPVGKVWAKVRSHTNIDLYDSDKEHPNKNGSYLAASTFFGAIFDENIDQVYTSTIKAKNAEIIKSDMYAVLAEYRKFYKLDVNRFVVKWYTSKKGEFVMEGISNFVKAKSITWKFGDGTSSNQLRPIHKYAKPGKYVVEIIVEDECGIRKASRELVFAPVKLPEARKPSSPVVNKTADKKL